MEGSHIGLLSTCEHLSLELSFPKCSGHNGVCVCVCVCVSARVRTCAQPCLTLCDPIDCGPPGSSVRGISWVRTLEWVAISFSRGSSGARDGNHVSCTIFCTNRRILYHFAT